MKTRTFRLAAVVGLIALIFQGCSPSDDPSSVVLPLLTTNQLTEITQTSAKGGGTISIENNVEIIVSGLCWSLRHNPTITDSLTTDDTAYGSFSNTLRNLLPDTTYYVRAYATSSNGTGYGQELSFRTLGVSIPILTTNNPSTVNNTSIAISSTYTNQGGLPILSKGFCWGISNNPTVDNNKIEVAGSTFSANITHLMSGDTYYVRAYAINSEGIGYGNSQQFTTKISDVEGHTYHSVKIGTQTWMVENLKTGKFRNGTAIPFVTDDSWNDMTTPAYNTNYGYKYNWFSVNDSTKQLAPEGWHVPTIEEWNTLLDFIGGASVAGSKLKERGATHWPSPNTEATNEYGFTAIPQGYFDVYNFNTSTLAIWWANSEDPNKQYEWYEEPSDEVCAWYIEINSSRSDALKNSAQKDNGFSVRCIRDN